MPQNFVIGLPAYEICVRTSVLQMYRIGYAFMCYFLSAALCCCILNPACPLSPQGDLPFCT